MNRLSYKILFLFLIFTYQILPQAFGFGCLGFIGGFGGYSYQQYKPDGLNSYVANFNLNNSEYLENKMSDFGKASGYRVGVNVFRAKFTGLLITAKGYYQQLQEGHAAIDYQTGFAKNTNFDLKLKSWGIGVDLGIPITDFLNWKIIDGSLLINSARFTETINSQEGTSVKKFDNEKTEFGYSVGSGFIFEILKDYISLEGVASYSVITIDKMKNEDGSILINNPNKNLNSEKFINTGGFSAVLQLNLGFPL
ncbi:MAG: hypothetical protein IPJ23_07185 [Ignavibacteriales bacterium]|nr:hypothetical protein [Ignavibacteriales bacterium]